MATAFATVAQAATTAPLNTNYKEDEFAFYLEDLGARAIVLAADEDGAAFRAARRFGLIVLRVAVPEGASPDRAGHDHRQRRERRAVVVLP